jgi:hypothetical protein
MLGSHAHQDALKACRIRPTHTAQAIRGATGHFSTSQLPDDHKLTRPAGTQEQTYSNGNQSAISTRTMAGQAGRAAAAEPAY